MHRQFGFAAVGCVFRSDVRPIVRRRLERLHDVSRFHRRQHVGDGLDRGLDRLRGITSL